MKHPGRSIVVPCCVACILGAAARAPAAEIDHYLAKADPSYSWKVSESRRTPEGTVTEIALISQTWQGITWNHRLRVYEGSGPSFPNAMLLFITGGSTQSKPGPGDEATGFALSRISGARVAVLHQVPNQPLLGGKTEDTLIAETFVRYLETRDASWPLLFPMVKSAHKAMDALQTWTREEKKPTPSKFVVSGASKRGWTTWLTGATDPRVVAIAPMVIDTLNFRAQKTHWMEVWGKPSDQIDDYTRRGLNEKIETPDGEQLWKMVDPFSYLDRLKMPKLLINGTNDPYWTLDALNIYWDDLKGPKSVVYLPNAGHGLQEHRDYALAGVGALLRHTITGKPWPSLSWTHSDAPDGRLHLSVNSTPAPKSARAWVARGATRDFRQVHWDNVPMSVAGESARVDVERPRSGYIALLGDLEYEIDGVSYHLSTQVRQAGATATPGH